MSAYEEFEDRRNELFELNTRAWNGEEDVFKTSEKLDTSLKKNTAFIKKLRTGINKESEAWIINSIETTSLKQYMTEIAAALCESLIGVSKNADVQSAVEIISALHQRFTSDFTPLIELYFAHSFDHPKEKLTKREMSMYILKVKNLMKLSMELNLVGVFRKIDDMPASELPPYLSRIVEAKKEDISLIIPMLKHVMSFQFDAGLTLPVFSSFLNIYGHVFLDPQNLHYETPLCTSLRKLFKAYTKSAVTVTESLAKTLRKNKNKSVAISVKTGRLVDDLDARILTMQELYENFSTFCETYATMLDVEKPVEIVEPEPENAPIIVDSPSIWANKEQKAFYEDTPTLESIVSEEVLSAVNAKIRAEESKGTKFANILVRLSTATTASEVDEIVVDFWNSGLSNKASRNRLSTYILDLKDVSKFRNIGRFWKINYEYFKPQIEELITKLDNSFRFQIHTERLNEKDIVIFTELIKFKMIPLHVVIHKIRSLILNIELNNNIDLLSLMFDQCGKLFLHDPEYAGYTKQLLKLLVEMYKTKNFSHTDKHAVRIFLLSLNPPKVNPQNRVKLTKEEEFIEYMMKTQLKENTSKSVAEILKKMDWKNPIVANRIRNILSKPADLSFENIEHLAYVLKLLTTDVQLFLRTQVIDQIIEDITIGLENNDNTNYRVRISQCIYFTELVNLQVLHGDRLVPMLYKIVCFGHANNSPSKNQLCELDEPDDHFRIRLIAEILGRLNLRNFGSAFAIELFTFMNFFNYYISTKELPLVIDLDVKVNVVFAKVNKSLQHYSLKTVERIDDYEDAVIALKHSMGNPNASTKYKPAGEKEITSSKTRSNAIDIGDESNRFQSKPVKNKDTIVKQSEKLNVVDEKSDNDDDYDDFPRGDTLFEQEELDIALIKATSDSMHVNTNTKVSKGLLSDNIGTPSDIRFQMKKKENSNEETYESENSSETGVKFTLMGRTGAKINPRKIVIPEDDKFAITFTREQERIAAENHKIKQHILNMHHFRED